MCYQCAGSASQGCWAPGTVVREVASAEVPVLAEAGIAAADAAALSIRQDTNIAAQAQLM